MVAPTERKQESTGPIWLNDIDPELAVTPLLDSGSYCQDKYAQLLSRDLEYGVEHMGKEKTVSAALQLQHDAGLLPNIQVLQQLVTSMGRTASDVLLAVQGREALPSSALQQVIPSYRVRRASHHMSAMGLWRPPVETVSRTAMSSVACTSCQDCCPRVPRWNEK